MILMMLMMPVVLDRVSSNLNPVAVYWIVSPHAWHELDVHVEVAGNEVDQPELRCHSMRIQLVASV